jgi:hypothetical protein
MKFQFTLFQFIFIFLLLSHSINLFGQYKNKYFEVYFGTNYCTQQAHWIEEQQSNTNPFVKNSPQWRWLFHAGLDYTIKFNRLNLGLGLKLQEKGGKNIAYTLLSTNSEREDNVTMFLLLRGKTEFYVTRHISIVNSITFGRDVFKFIAINVREWSLETGLKYDLSSRVGIGILFSQGLNDMQYQYTSKVKHILVDGSVFLKF